MPRDVRHEGRGAPADGYTSQARGLLRHGVAVSINDVQVDDAVVRRNGQKTSVG